MDSLDLEVLKTCADWVGAGLRCELVTVVSTWGSSPRPEGATLGICEDGSVVGSVSGGCIEDDLIAEVRERGVVRELPELVVYGVSAEEAHKFGLPCGGTIRLVIEPLGQHSRLQELLGMLGEHKLVARRLTFGDGSVELGEAERDAAVSLDRMGLTTVHGPRWRLLVIGAGELSRFLARVALGMGYDVTVCDPREEYRQGWDVPGVRVVHAMPDDLVIEMKLDSRSASSR